jgi:DNA-binding response OmpR family regulator
MNMNTKGKSMLVVEDDDKIRTLIKLYLEREGYEVLEARDGEEALAVFKKFDPCILILDLMLPKFNGEIFCQNIRENMRSDIPIIMLTAKNDEASCIQGFKMGADDYITKPFRPMELVARVEAVLRRTSQRCGKISYRGLIIKPLRREVYYQGEPICLTQHEFRLLYFLMKHPNQILTRDQILAELYPNNEKVVIERTVDVHVGKLREKLQLHGGNNLISTIRGIGFRFEAF